ncbi:MAG TPA: T9SS type A sorting domain-containing protein [Chitinophagales bacterium]|nr:T9SS type A sorting domain-containing protein [Chitinophagales bacterium]
MKLNFTLSILLLCFFSTLKAQEECSQRYKDKIFEKVDYTGNFVFSTNENIGGVMRDIKYDFYEPAGDTAPLRPLIILWHGGAFLDIFNKRSPDIILIAHEFVKRGYTVISADYRGVKNAFDLLKEKEIVKEVVRSVIDGNDLICKIMDDINNNGNPHRINKDEIFAGGVSGGAILGMHLMYIKSLDQMPGEYKKWALEVDNGGGEIALQNKFCSPNPIKGFISISGAILDTAWIQKSDMSLLIFHGGIDNLVPYEYAQPLFGAKDLPYVYGGKLIHEQAQRVGINTTFIDYPERGHVPYMNITGTNVMELIQEVSNGLINDEIFIKDMQTMTDFLSSQVECEKIVVEPTALRPINSIAINLYPNPVNDYFEIQLPESKKWNINILDVSGRSVLQNQFVGNQYQQLAKNLSPGMYVVQISNSDEPEKVFIGKIVQQKLD